MKKLIVLTMMTLSILACSDADIASNNLSRAAEQFELDRRVVFYNGITGEYILTIRGRCSVEEQASGMLAATCKTGPEQFKKHYLGLSDNVTFFSEQLKPAKASVYHYRVIFKPQTIVPDVDFRSSVTD